MRKQTRPVTSLKTVVTKQQNRVALYGSQLRVRNDPTPVQSTPWNQITVVSKLTPTSTGTNYISSTAIGVSLRDQLDLPTGTTVELALRVQEIKLWAEPSITGTDNNVVNLGPCDLVESTGITQETTVIRKWLEDRGTVVRPAAVGYTWPASDRDVVFRSSADEQVVFVFGASSTSQSYLSHIRLLWRPYQTSAVFRVKQPLVGRMLLSDQISNQAQEAEICGDLLNLSLED